MMSNTYKKLKFTTQQSIFLSWLLYISVCLAIISYHWFCTWYLPKYEFQTNLEFEIQSLNKNYELITSVELLDGNREVFMQLSQEYKFILELDVPTSEQNFNIGIFGITGELSDENDEIVYLFKTTGTLTYQHGITRYLLAFFQFPFSLFSSQAQQQKLTIILCDKYFEKTYTGSRKLIIRIHERLQFYKANLSVCAQFTGLKYYMHHWYYSTGLFICSSLITFIFAVLVSIFYDIKSLIAVNFSFFYNAELGAKDETKVNKDYYESIKTDDANENVENEDSKLHETPPEVRNVRRRNSMMNVN